MTFLRRLTDDDAQIPPRINLTAFSSFFSLQAVLADEEVDDPVAPVHLLKSSLEMETVQALVAEDGWGDEFFLLYQHL